MDFFEDIIVSEDIHPAHASVCRATKTLYLNPLKWPYLTKAEQRIIMLHELGHLNLNTSSEIKADGYAFENFALSEKYSLSNLLDSLANSLFFNKKEDYERYYKQVERVEEIMETLNYNGNMNTNTKIQNGLKDSFVTYISAKGISYKRFLELPEADRERIGLEYQKSKRFKNFKKEVESEYPLDHNIFDALGSGASSATDVSSSTSSFSWSGLISSITGIGSQVIASDTNKTIANSNSDIAKWNAYSDQAKSSAALASAKALDAKKTNYMPWIIIGVVVVALVVVAIFAFKKKS